MTEHLLLVDEGKSESREVRCLIRFTLRISSVSCDV